MLRACYILLIAVAATCFVDVRPADAAPVSTRNPYRSFNISGVNYGSMKWEREHRGRSTGWHRGGGLFLRRR